MVLQAPLSPRVCCFINKFIHDLTRARIDNRAFYFSAHSCTLLKVLAGKVARGTACFRRAQFSCVLSGAQTLATLRSFFSKVFFADVAFSTQSSFSRCDFAGTYSILYLFYFSHKLYLPPILQLSPPGCLDPGHWKYLQPPSVDKVIQQRAPNFWQLTTISQQSSARLHASLLEKASPSILNFEDVDRRGLDDLLKAFKNLEFDDVLQQNLWIVVAAVLHLGNVTFEAANALDVNEACTVDTLNPSARAFCDLMGCSIKDLDTALCKRTISVRGAGSGSSRSPAPRPGRRPSIQQTLSPQMAAALGNAVEDFVVVKSVKLDDAVRARDVLSKSLYNGLFESVVSKTNGMLVGFGGDSRSWIGVLDIFGFEHFDLNGFEQLCINYANEKLQQLFTSTFIGKEQVVYICESIQWNELDFKDNKDVIALMEQQHPCLGVFATLDEVCRTVGGTDRGIIASLCNSFVETKKPNPFLKRSRYATDDNFVIVHYAASVTYNCSGMLDKNRDAMLSPIKTVIELCSSDAATRVKAHISEISSSSSDHSKLGGLHRTLSSRFQLQIRALLDVLSDASSTFVRCLKSNTDKMPFCIHEGTMRLQLVSSGLLDTTRITQMGFPFRMPFLSFLNDNFQLVDQRANLIEKLEKSCLQDMCRNVMESIQVCSDHYKIGTTLIFFKAGVAITLEKAKLAKIALSASLIQASARSIHQRSVWCCSRTCAIKLQCCVRLFLAKLCAMSRLVAKMMLQGYLRSFIVKRSCASIVSAGQYLRGRLVAVSMQTRTHWRLTSARRLCMHILSILHRHAYLLELANRNVAKQQLQARMRSVYARQSHVSLLSAGQYLRGRLVALAIQTHAHRCVISAFALQMRIISYMAKHAYIQELTCHRIKAAASALIVAMICRRLHFRRAFGAQQLLNSAVLRVFVRDEVCNLRIFAFAMQSKVRCVLKRSWYFQRKVAVDLLLPYIRPLGRGLRDAFINAYQCARVVSAASARALSRSWYIDQTVAVQPLEAVISRCLSAPKYFESRRSACILQAFSRAFSIRILKTRMELMMSKKFLQSRFRRWSIRRRYCVKLLAAFRFCCCISRERTRSRYTVQISAAVRVISYLRCCCRQRRLTRKIEAAAAIQSVVRMTSLRRRFSNIIKASTVIAAG